MAELVKALIKKNSEEQLPAGASKRRLELRQKADAALAFLPVDMMNGGGAASWKQTSDVIDQMFSESDVLEFENETLRRNHDALSNTIDSFQEQYRREVESLFVFFIDKWQRTWRGDDQLECSKCSAEFTFWNKSQYCRSCAGTPHLPLLIILSPRDLLFHLLR